MTETTKNEIVDTAQVTEVEDQQDETSKEPVSDSKMLFAPLARYGVIAILIVGVIVTTAIMLNDSSSTTDEQVVTVEASDASQDQVETVITADTNATAEAAVVTTEIADAAVVEVTTATEAAAVTETTPVAFVTENTAVVSAPAVSAPVAMTTTFTPPEFDHRARIAEHHAYIAQQDQEYLDSLKVRQAERIQALQQQVARQQQRIEEIEKRNQEIYETRAASIKHMQQLREESLNRI